VSTQGLINPQQGVVVQKPRFDVYTMMLLIAFFAIVIGIVCLALELNRYQWDTKAPAVPSAMSAPAHLPGGAALG
jgi:hypothetical protein